MSETEKQPPEPAAEPKGRSSPPDYNNQKDTVYYYSRERRLSKASPAVQAMNDANASRPTLGKVMFGNRGNLFLLLGIVVICVSGLILNLINREPPATSSMIFGGNSLSLAVLSVEEVLILGIVKNAPQRGEFFIGDVDIAISPVLPRARDGEIQEEPQIFTHRVLFRPVESETFHITLPFDGGDFIIVLSTGDLQRSMRLRVVDTD